MKYLGQHFLRDEGVLQQIADSLKIKPGDVIIEIGAGHGELTMNLESRISNLKNKENDCKKISNLESSTKGGSTSGGKNNSVKIIAIEKDKELAKNLEIRIQNLGLKNIEIIEGDVLKILPQIVDLILKTSDVPNIKNNFRTSDVQKLLIHNSLFTIQDYKIVGNIPYYITGYLLRILGELENKPSLIVLTIQKEVAERICAKPPKINLLAASVQFWAKPEIVRFISRKSFSPQPKVDSVIIKFNIKTSDVRRTSDVQKLKYYNLIKVLFKQPRKTVLNNLSLVLKISKKEIIKILTEQGIKPNARPQNLTIRDLIVLSNVFQSKK